MIGLENRQRDPKFYKVEGIKLQAIVKSLELINLVAKTQVDT